MLSEKNKMLLESVKRLSRRNAVQHLRKIVNKTHAADLSAVFRSLSLAHQQQLFGLIDSLEQKGMLFGELDKDTFLDLVKGMDIDEIVEILESMPADDAAYVIDRFPEEQADAILTKMQKEESAEVEDLLRYEDDTAGRIMVPDFIALEQEMTAREVIESLQKEHLDVEMPFYIYVVDEYEKLVGVISLRQLVVVPPNKKLKDFMTTEVISVRTDVDQEEVARMVARYNILAVPVVDESNRLVGIITVDDVIDVFREEATEDMLKMAGAGEEFVETKSIYNSTRIRLPWLFASCIGGIIASMVISRFGAGLKEFAYLAAFIPVITGMGGNIGTQSSTIVVRGLATGRIIIRDLWKVVLKEISVALLLGCVYGTMMGLVAHWECGVWLMAVSVGLAVISSMSVAALVGSAIPMVLARIKIDPAVATGPFVTTSIDIIGVFLYFRIAMTLLPG
ncbi:MAG: magnesium transporter [Thermodesulfobacteriota bacterium]